MTNANRIVYLSFSIIIFCIASWLLLYNSKLCNDTLSHINIDYTEQELYPQVARHKDELVTYSQIIAYLCNIPEYDIVIDGIKISNEEFNPENIRSYEISRGFFNKSYQFDEMGNIKKIIYNSVSK